MSEQIIFDSAAIRRHRDRAASRLHIVRGVLDDLDERLLDRLEDTRHRFTRALDIGGRGGIAPALRARGMHVTSLDMSHAMAKGAGADNALCADPEWLPFAPGSFDLVIASCALHWVNDLPGALIQIRHAMRPDGLFLASLPVLGTLGALRTALTQAASDLSGGASPRISPFAELQDCAALLQRAGFALPVADVEDIEFLYANPLALLHDLRAAGETNAIRLRDRRVPHRALFPAALSSLPTKDGRTQAVLRLAFMTGWAPASSQPKPLRPGSGQISLAQVLNDTDET